MRHWYVKAVWKGPIVQLYEMKNDDLALNSLGVRGFPIFPRRAAEYPEEAIPLPFAECFKDQQVLSIHGMVPDGLIATLKRHIAVLPFTGIKEDIVFSPSIFVALLFPGFAGEQKDNWTRCRR
jgi:hypothetical protein